MVESIALTSSTLRDRKDTTPWLSYLREAHGIILCFALDSKNTFDRIERWVEDIRNTCIEEIPIILVGNKLDLPHKITEEEVKDKASTYNMGKYLVSAATGEGIEDLFGEIIEASINFRENRGSEHHEPIEDKAQVEQHKSKCCK